MAIVPIANLDAPATTCARVGGQYRLTGFFYQPPERRPGPSTCWDSMGASGQLGLTRLEPIPGCGE